MKKSILKQGLAVLFIGAMIISCDSPSKKVEKAEADVEAADKALEEANEAYFEDMANFRLQTDERIAANEKVIAEFNERIAKEKLDAKTDYKAKIAELEAKNNDLKKKMADYKAEGKENWEAFKIDFNKDMDALGLAIENFFTPSK